MSNSANDVQTLEARAGNPTTGLLRGAWEHWKTIGHAVGVVQTRVLMVIFYFVFVMPLGLVMRLRGDPLHLKPREVSNWSPHDHQERSVDAVRRQF